MDKIIIMKNLTVIMVLTLFLLVQSQPLVANERIIDADTIEISGEKIRLSGIDAPELNQTCRDSSERVYKCGTEAKKKLSGLVKSMLGYPIKCNFTGKDIYGRLIGECSVNNININSWLVRNGWAVAYRKYSEEYLDDEGFAQSNSLGIWQGSFIKPWRWRKGDRLGKKVELKKKGCNIKGNISSSDEKIYHTPNGQDYSRTKVSLQKGEKWFCSEKKALSEGWRKSKR